jgi:hypothetical protein
VPGWPWTEIFSPFPPLPFPSHRARNEGLIYGRQALHQWVQAQPSLSFLNTSFGAGCLMAYTYNPSYLGG